jgi:predicted lipid-binding transport protein (Tim44 family)
MKPKTAAHAATLTSLFPTASAGLELRAPSRAAAQAEQQAESFAEAMETGLTRIVLLGALLFVIFMLHLFLHLSPAWLYGAYLITAVGAVLTTAGVIRGIARG